MARTDNDSWEITASVGATALGVAKVKGVPVDRYTRAASSKRKALSTHGPDGSNLDAEDAFCH